MPVDYVPPTRMTRLEDQSEWRQMRADLALARLAQGMKALDPCLLPVERQRRITLLVSECDLTDAECGVVAEYIQRRLMPE